MRLAICAICALALGPATAQAANPIASENTRTGDSAWTSWDKQAGSDQIDGYASETSVFPGKTLHLHVSTPQRYRVEVDRLGWYNGAGGRRVACVPSCAGSEQGTARGRPPPDPQTGRVDAGWPVTDSVSIGSTWTTGYYLARFVLVTGPNAGKTRFYPFIVRAPAGNRSDILVQVPVNTWQAYDNWGGKSLYSFNSTGGRAAVKVSFNRPLTAAQNPVFGREYQAVRFLEREGYDLSYVTDDGVHDDPAELTRHPVDVVLGHDEYWTGAMRRGWDVARVTGHNLVFLGADTGTWQVRYENGDRTLVGYKSLVDPEPNPAAKTVMFRKLSPPLPECQLEGVQFDSNRHHPGRRSYTVASAAASNPWTKAAGLKPGALLANGVAYEWDAVTPGCSTPALTVLFHYEPPSGSGESPADAVAFRAGLARVFSSGSNQFSLLLDAYNSPSGQAADPRVGRFMKALLDDFVATGSRIGVASCGASRAARAGDLRLSHGRLHASGVRVRVLVRNRGPAKIRGRLMLRARIARRARTVARARFRVAACSRVRVPLLLSRKALSALRRHYLRATLTASFRSDHKRPVRRSVLRVVSSRRG